MEKELAEVLAPAGFWPRNSTRRYNAQSFAHTMFGSPLVSLTPLPYTQNSAHWFTRVRDMGTPVWLDSARPYSQRGRYDIIAAGPLEVLRDDGSNDPFTRVRECLAERLPPIAPGTSQLPFKGGAIGFFGYEAGRRLHGLIPRTEHEPHYPGLLVGLYSWAIVSDHHSKLTTLALREETSAAVRKELEYRLRSEQVSLRGGFTLQSEWHDDFPAERYRAAFERLQDYIQAGDCYQTNLARRFHADYRGDAFEAYLRLRVAAAAPFSGFLESEEGAILCLSPERLLSARDGQLFAQPIKGTAPRRDDPDEDRRSAQTLLDSEKNRAENLMIVDLLRNDLGHSCIPGSIAVEQLFELQSFNSVHHLVSSIRGELREGVHPLQALRECFPGGSITGAPKLRAMQIIDEMEPFSRSVFCGALGYMDANGDLDTNITIRTLLAQRNKLYLWAGGGIVADSACDDELAETIAKVKVLFDAIHR